MKPQRLGVVYSGFGADEIAGFIVLFDGVAPEPVLDARIIVIQSPEGLGRRSAMEPTAEDLGNGLGQSETLELVQEPFKEMGAKTRGAKHDVGRDLDLAQVPVVFEELGPGGIFSFVEPEEHIHPIGDPVEYGSAIERLGGFLEGFGVVDIDKGIVLEPVLDALSVEL